MTSRIRIRFGEGRVFQLRVELADVTPTIWRRLAVSARASLRELHDVIDCAIGSSLDAGYAFDIDGVRYLDPVDEPPPGREADAVSLEALGLHSGARFEHIAENHGEPWRHILTLEQAAPRLVGQRLPACLAGARAAPPDDCAGPRAYRELIDALADPTDPHTAELRSWLPDNFDPGYADVTAINASLARVRKHRPAA
jgi:hypothetical protein